MILASPASASTLEILYDIPRFALTVRLNSPSKTENTSVVAPPISTPIKFKCSRLAIVSIITPTAAGVGMIGAPAISISFL